jgi:hypothetical protein
MGVQTGLIWLRIGSDGAVVNAVTNFLASQNAGNFFLGEGLLASQKELWSKELVG